jgi:type II secretory pathway predicted ATPase ExeA
MYERFYGFRERPFDLTPNPKYLVLTAGHQEALSNLEYAIASAKGITLLVGEAGAGKTTVICAAIARQASRVHCVHLHNPALTREEFIEMLAARFGLSERARVSKASFLLELEGMLRRRRDAGDTTLLVVDEAQSLPFELLEEIRLLANIETNSEKLLPLIIAGQPEISERLNANELRQLKQRIALRCELRSLNETETIAYIAARIRAAGGVASQIFTREAVMLINDRAKGLPRTINVLADNALVAGFATEQRPVTSALVREVCRDFDIQVSGRDDDDSVLGIVVSEAPDLTRESMFERKPSFAAVDTPENPGGDAEPAKGDTATGSAFEDLVRRRRFSLPG